MDLVDIDIVGAQATQRLIDAPLQSHFYGHRFVECLQAARRLLKLPPMRYIRNLRPAPRHRRVSLGIHSDA